MGKMNVRFLGSGDAFGSGGRFQTCIYVHPEGFRLEGRGPTRLLVDCGASSLVAMKRYGVETSDIDAILLSHLHGDHFGGLPFFILEARYVSNRQKPLVVAGPPGLEVRINEAMEVLYPGSSESEQSFALEFVELREETSAEIGLFTIIPYQVVHPSGAPAYAMRISYEDKILAFSGDTEWTDTLIKVASEADLFICECNSFDRVPNHLDYRTLMKHREELGCRRFVLTHMGEEMLRWVGELDLEDRKSVV